MGLANKTNFDKIVGNRLRGVDSVLVKVCPFALTRAYGTNGLISTVVQGISHGTLSWTLLSWATIRLQKHQRKLCPTKQGWTPRVSWKFEVLFSVITCGIIGTPYVAHKELRLGRTRILTRTFCKHQEGFRVRMSNASISRPRSRPWCSKCEKPLRSRSTTPARWKAYNDPQIPGW